MTSTEIATPNLQLDLPGSLQFWESLWSQLQYNEFWSTKLRSAGLALDGSMRPDNFKPALSVHLGVFVEPFLQYVLEGSKTIESRFSTRRFAPYGYAQAGDLILLKKSGGSVVGVCNISHVWFYHLDPHSWNTIKAQFTTALRAEDPEFWVQRQGAEFATLMRINHVHGIDPLHFPKRDRRGWSVLVDSSGTKSGHLNYPHSGLLVDA